VPQAEIDEARLADFVDPSWDASEQHEMVYYHKYFIDQRLAPWSYERLEVAGGVPSDRYLFSSASVRTWTTAGAKWTPPTSKMCPRHHVQLPAIGVCDECA
jgi:hypothetical protein